MNDQPVCSKCAGNYYVGILRWIDKGGSTRKTKPLCTTCAATERNRLFFDLRCLKVTWRLEEFAGKGG